MLSIVIGMGLAQLDPGWENDKMGTSNITHINMPLRFIGIGTKDSQIKFYILKLPSLLSYSK
jgi:hypothetical protein